MRITVAGAILAASILAAPAARGAEDPPGPGWDTLAYVEPAPTYRLRLALEELFGVGAALVGYSLQNPPPPLEGASCTILPWEKLSFQPGSWSFDADDYGTNMGGHVVSGTVYYLIARGNRVSIPEAFAWTFAASLLWEVTEYKEPASINDQIMTPVGGLAVGEAFSQLSSWFDRSGEGGLSWALAFLFNPARKLHDWIDGATPDRDPRTRGWHEFTVLAGVGALAQSAAGTSFAIGQVTVGSRLFRAPGHGLPGSEPFRWTDGNASRIGLGVTFTSGSVIDFLFETETALVGAYLRGIASDAEGLEGWDLFIGGTAGYEYGLHRWNVLTGTPDHITLVRLPGLELRARWFSGPWTLSAGADAALTFGGVQPFALQPPAPPLPPGTALPAVLLASGYYYAIGFRGAPSVEVWWRDAAVGASFQVDLLTGLTQPDVVPMPGRMIQLDDQRWTLTAWGRFRVVDPGLQFGLVGAWRSRSGSADSFHASAQERSIVGNLGVLF